LDPGTPGGPEIHSGGTIGPDRTTGPVQLDRILADLTTNTRNDLRTVIQGLGQTLTQTQGGGKGESTSQSLNPASTNTPQAFRGIAQVMNGLQGEQPRDLSNLIEGSNKTFSGFASQQSQLADLITNFNNTVAATASKQQQLSRSVALLPPVL